MLTPLLMTKLNVPQLRALRVPRSGLVDQLNTGLLGKLTLVCAPAGYGKTTLILEWLSQLSQEYSPSWITLDENDNDPTRFLAYIIAAIQQYFADFGINTTNLLQTNPSLPDNVILTTLLNDLARVPSPAVLILDDYHYIHTPAIHNLLATWLEHQPSTTHLVIISREDPLLPIARLRARGELNEIRQDHLRFSLEESAEFFQNVMNIATSTEDLAALDRKTEGWIAGLQLAALSMKHYDNPSSFIKAFTGSSRYILDYLVDEVIDRQTNEIQEFLMQTSILERISGPLCDAVMRDNNSQKILEFLEQNNLFILPLDQSRCWYRYHRLFAELLQHRLRSTKPDLLTVLHLRASEWFEENDFVAESIQHAIVAQKWERVAQILTSINTQMLKQGEAATLVRWYGAIPEDVLRSNPRLCFDYSWPLLLTGQYEKAAELLVYVEEIASEIPTFLGEVFTAQAFLARAQGDIPTMVERSERARALLPPESTNSRCLVAINLGLAYWHLGDMEATEEILREAFETSQASDNLYALMTAIILQGRVKAVSGQLHDAAKEFEQAIERGGQLSINALAHLDLCALYYEWNQLDKAEPHLKKAFELSRYGRNEEFEIACWMMQSALQLAQGMPQRAKTALSSAQTIIDKGRIPPMMVTRFKSAKIRFMLDQDNAAAIRYLGENIAEDVDAHNFNRFTNLTKANLLFVQNKREQAEDYLAELAQKAIQKGWQYTLIAVRAHQTLVAKSDEMKLHFLTEALSLAHAEGYQRTFADLGPGLIPYLKEAAQCGIEPAYVREILLAMRSQPKSSDPGVSFVEPLSEREIEVLRLIVAGLTNREIAQNLVISLGTAKTHIHNIYGKLEAKNRAQAIARAREFELV